MRISQSRHKCTAEKQEKILKPGIRPSKSVRRPPKGSVICIWRKIKDRAQGESKRITDIRELRKDPRVVSKPIMRNYSLAKLIKNTDTRIYPPKTIYNTGKLLKWQESVNKVISRPRVSHLDGLHGRGSISPAGIHKYPFINGSSEGRMFRILQEEGRCVYEIACSFKNSLNQTRDVWIRHADVKYWWHAESKRQCMTSNLTNGGLEILLENARKLPSEGRK